MISIKKAIHIVLITVLTMSLTTPAIAQQKSPKKAAFLSILLPGTGELYAGGHKSSRFFLFSEGVFWTGLFAFKKLNQSRENTFKTFARTHAQTSAENKPNSFYDRIVLYNSLYDYNARLRYLNGNSAEPLPDTPDNFWEWDSRQSREKFHDLRSKATWARTRSFLFVGTLLFNRFASALNAAHIAKKTLPTATITPTPQGDLQAQISFRF